LRIKSDITFSNSPDSRALGVTIGPFVWNCELKDTVGTYEPESDGINSFAWTRTQASYPLQLKGSALLVPVLPNSSIIKNPIQAEFYGDHTLLKRFSLTQLKWQMAELSLPKNVNPAGVLTVHVSRTWNAKTNGVSNDSRDLGIAIGEMQWKGA